MSATKIAPDKPELDVREAERQDDDVEAQPLGQPDEPGQERQDRQVAEPDGTEDALLEPLVQLEDARRERQPDEDPSAEVAHREQPDGGHDHDHDADDEDEPDRLGQAAPEAPEPGGEPEDRDREDVEDALDEDRAEGPAERRRRCSS